MKQLMILIVSFFAMLFIIVPVTAEPRADSSIWLYNGHAYQLFPEHIDWHAAKKRCEDMGGYLVCIESEDENSFLYNKVKDINGTIHLGGTSEEQGTWKWVNGKPFTFTHWGKGQPNNFRGEEHWLVINPGDRLKDRWNDAPSFIPDGRQRSYGFICEWDNPEAAYNATAAPAAAAAYNATAAPAAAAASSSSSSSSAAAPPAETSAVNAVTSDNPVKRKIAGNFMYTPADLTNFENQLDYIEKTFWIAASSNKNDSFYKDIEKKIFILVNSSRVIQSTLISEKKNQDLDLPRRTCKLQDVWHVFAGKGHYYYDTLRCSSRRNYGNYKADNTTAYLQWLQDTMVYNIAQFKNIDNSALNSKISDYFMAIKELRSGIVDVSELKLFDENPQLGESDKSIVKGNGGPPPQKKKR